MGGPEWGAGLWQVGNGWSGSRLGVGERGAVRKWGLQGGHRVRGKQQMGRRPQREGGRDLDTRQQVGKEGSYWGGRPPHLRLKRAEPPSLQGTVACEIGGKAIFNFERNC